MSSKSVFPFLLILTTILSACTFPFFTTPMITPSTTVLAAANTPLPTNTPVTTETLAPIPTSSIVPVSIPYSGTYVDDRSTPWELIVSLFNAVSRKEYLRAYDYWRNPSESLGDFESYAAGYADTGTVDLVFGQLSGDAGAGQVYYTVPVIIKATATNGVRANYAACYIVHYSQPANFGAPPFQPMAIDRGTATNSALNADDASVLSTTCNSYPVGANPVAITTNNLSIDKNNYLNNRSGAIEAVSSMLNALNLKQYVRAYYYFQYPATYPGAYAGYAAGYSNTDTITATFGTVQQEGAAGSLYYKLPLAMVVLTTTGTTQTFVGCYTLRLGQPAVQATPPFQPMGIIAGTFTQVANDADVTSMLPTACP